jgi:hypothetical protein
MRNLLFIAVLGMSTLAVGETWNNAVLIDQACSAKAKNNPDMHTRACAMQCARAGFGILTSDGRFLKFDQDGNKRAMNLLSSTDKKDHLRVNVQGEQKGDTITITSISF